IQTALINNFLVISVRNNGQIHQPLEQLVQRGGIGIKNTIKRLEILYGQKASFNIYNQDASHVVSVIKIPVEK
ncbi:MAG TPA: hypothetical protein VGD31_14420, partial [Sphingobacteriaceae bacterium]